MDDVISNFSGCRILIADNDVASRRLLTNLLGARAARIVEAGDALAILDIARAIIQGDPGSRFDLILADVAMPGFSALDILAALRAMHADGPPVIVLSSVRDGKIFRRAEQLGAAAIVEKPLRTDRVLVALGVAMRRARSIAAPQAVGNAGRKGE